MAATAALVPVLCFVFAFVFTTSAPAGNSVAEAAALLGELMLWALARHAILERQRALVEARGEGARLRLCLDDVGGDRRGHGRIAGRRLSPWRCPGRCRLPANPRASHGRRPSLSTTVVDPVDSLASLRRYDPSAPPKTFFTVQVFEGPWSGYLPVADLDDYDGDSWSFSATFRPTGGRVPSPADGADQTGERGRPALHAPALVRAAVPPGARPPGAGKWVVGLTTDATTGMLAASPALPASYTVLSRVGPGYAGPDQADNADRVRGTLCPVAIRPRTRTCRPVRTEISPRACAFRPT